MKGGTKETIHNTSHEFCAQFALLVCRIRLHLRNELLWSGGGAGVLTIFGNIQGTMNYRLDRHCPSAAIWPSCVYEKPPISADISHVLMRCHFSNLPMPKITYLQVSNIRRTLIGIKVVDHSDVVGASPAGAAPTATSFNSRLNAWLQYIARIQLQDGTRNN